MPAKRSGLRGIRYQHALRQGLDGVPAQPAVQVLSTCPSTIPRYDRSWTVTKKLSTVGTQIRISFNRGPDQSVHSGVWHNAGGGAHRAAPDHAPTTQAIGVSGGAVCQTKPRRQPAPSAGSALGPAAVAVCGDRGVGGGAGPSQCGGGRLRQLVGRRGRGGRGPVGSAADHVGCHAPPIAVVDSRAGRRHAGLPGPADLPVARRSAPRIGRSARGSAGPGGCRTGL